MDRIPSALETKIRQEISDAFERNKTIEEVFKRLRTGAATYEDADLFAEELGKILENVIVDSVDINIDIEDLAYNIVGNCINQNYKISSIICETVQQTLNEAADVGLAPVVPELNIAEISEIQNEILAIKTEDNLIDIAQKISTASEKTVDDFVRTNAEFQRKAGLSPVIVRKWSGSWPSHDSKHTDWCKEIAGTYEYTHTYSIDSRVFSRHKGCRCTVAYYPSNKAKGRITALAKGEKDVNEVLWNTGAELSNNRHAVLARRRRQYGREEARKILNEEWKGGFNGNAERHF